MEITHQTINIEKIIKGKTGKYYKFIPDFIINLFKKLLHEDELNKYLYKNKDKIGIDFATAILLDFGCEINVIGKENLKADGRYIVAANHPLGGLDGMALISEIGKIKGNVLFPVTDFLLFLPTLEPIFVPINKTGKNAIENQKKLKQAFDSDATILYFPAGLCSRKNKKGEIRDLKWKKTFVTKAKETKRDIIPVYINGKNSNFFYNLARFRRMLNINLNIEQAFLVNEMFKQRGQSIDIHIGKPIKNSYLEKSSYGDARIANRIEDYVYSLNNCPVEFNIEQ